MFAAASPPIADAQEYMQIVSLEDTDGIEATFISAGISEKKADVGANAAKSVFYTLFYRGVAGINDGKPLVTHENKLYTNQFFNSTARYTFYTVSSVDVEKPKKSGSIFRGTYRVRIYMKRLVDDMVSNDVFHPKLTVYDVDEMEEVTKPTIIVVPYRKSGESYEAVLQGDFDRRIAVSKVQNGFEARNITTIDLQAKLDAVRRRSDYEDNQATAESSDKQLLLTSGADVYVTVDLKKEQNLARGARVALIMKAYETATGNVLASKEGWTMYFRTEATDLLCGYAVEDELPGFLDDICKNFTKRLSHGSRVVLQFAIGGTSVVTFSDPVGSQGYSLSNVIRQWVRRNAYEGKYHLQGIVEESMIFDYVMIPPLDEDGLVMDAAQYAFLIESYLKEDQNVSCSSRIDGNNILITIL